MGKNDLIDKKYWNNYWKDISLPLEIKKTKKNLYLNEILNVFDKYLQINENLSVLEIGGSPGQFLVYMHNNYKYNINCLDYSEIGCLKTEDNFKLLNINGMVYKEDLFSENLNLPMFDIVYSLGFIEHFNDINLVISNHLKLLKPGGILLIGTPNLKGIYRWFLKRLAPELLSQHNLSTMNISNWKSFELEYKLEVMFKGYVGGFEPYIFKRKEKASFRNDILLFIAKVLNFFLHSHFRFLRKYNSKKISGYVLGIYKKPNL